MERCCRGCDGCLATAVASTVRLVALMMTVTRSLADPTSTSARGFPPVSTNRCSDFDLSGFTKAMDCGSPLSSPCFDFSRCRESPPAVYVYDQEVSDTEQFLASLITNRNEDVDHFESSHPSRGIESILCTLAWPFLCTRRLRSVLSCRQQRDPKQYSWAGRALPQSREGRGGACRNVRKRLRLHQRTYPPNFSIERQVCAGSLTMLLFS